VLELVEEERWKKGKIHNILQCMATGNLLESKKQNLRKKNGNINKSSE
jgi:hypothetical protein